MTIAFSSRATESGYSFAMQILRRLHLYLGCLFAPVLILFAVSGTWQLFNFHKTKKDGSYIAPRSLVTMSSIHMESHLSGKNAHAFTPLRYFMVAAAAGLVITSILGVIMAYKFSRQPGIATVCLLLGVAIPAVMLWIYK